MPTIIIRRIVDGAPSISPEVFPIDAGDEQRAMQQLTDYGYRDVDFYLLDEETMTCTKLVKED